MSTSPATDCGIPSIGRIPWGSHFCHFYSKREDLVAVLVAYFRAGLKNNERGIWVTADPLRAAEAQLELQRVMPDLEKFLRKQQITIFDSDEWYRAIHPGDASDMVDQWLREEKETLDAGYAGLRISGNTSFLKQEQWPLFLDYERKVNRLFRTRRIIALCSYNIRNCSAGNLFEVVRTHHFTVDRVEGSWQIIESEREPFRE